jgi:hypothetical protein
MFGCDFVLFRFKVWEILNFELIFVIRNSIELQKVRFGRKFWLRNEFALEPTTHVTLIEYDVKTFIIIVINNIVKK